MTQPIKHAPEFGKLIEGEETRDAVHLACAPVIAAHRLAPGQPIGLDESGKASVSVKPIGIVDPFLKQIVEQEQKFWLVLFPNTITSLRHEWEHPAFPDQPASTPTTDSETWLRAYAMRMNSYDTPQEAFDRLIDGIKSRELLANGSDLHGFSELDDSEALRFHAERFLGIQINWGDFQFTCSC